MGEFCWDEETVIHVSIESVHSYIWSHQYVFKQINGTPKSIVLPHLWEGQKKRTSLCMSKMLQSKSRTYLYSTSLVKEKADVAGKHS